MLTIPQNWSEFLKSETDKDYFKNLLIFIEKEYKEKVIFPAQENIFKSLELCDLNKLKIVILGQDPYHNLNQANGLCFSVNQGVTLPPSLKNIFKEIQDDIGKPIPMTGDLSFWSKQGVLLLNSIFTVEQNKAGSHKNKGWEIFSDEIIKLISEKKDKIVFILWGNFAKSKREYIDKSKHLILEAAHPSPFSAHSGFFGCKHFSKANDFLTKNKIEIINW